MQFFSDQTVVAKPIIDVHSLFAKGTEKICLQCPQDATSTLPFCDGQIIRISLTPPTLKFSFEILSKQNLIEYTVVVAIVGLENFLT